MCVRERDDERDEKLKARSTAYAALSTKAPKRVETGPPDGKGKDPSKRPSLSHLINVQILYYLFTP